MAFRVGKKKNAGDQETEKLAGIGAAKVRLSFMMDKSIHTRLKLEAVRQSKTIVGMLEGFVAERTPTV